MKILIVEDDEDQIAVFEAEFPAGGAVEVAYARSLDSARSLISGGQFDLAVLDLKIPTQDGNLDSDINHGLSVHSILREAAQGTPVIVFSGHGTFRDAGQLGENSTRHDIWGSGQEQAITVCREKSQLAECLGLIKQASDHLDALNQIAVSTGGRTLNLAADEKRILRIFTRMNQGVNARVSGLGGGLSSAKTVRMEVIDQHAAVKSIAVAKLGFITDLMDEEARYHRCITPAFGVGGFAHLIKFQRAGAAGKGGLFYGFAKDYSQSLLDLLIADPARAAATIADLRRLESTWQSHATLKTMTVADIRRELIADDKFLPAATKLKFDWQSFERHQVRVKCCCQHRDLHGLNVLVQAGEIPILIDYGAVGHAPACLDPLILELSILFHAECKRARGSWPTISEIGNWTDLDTYLQTTPLAPFIRACREWAFEVEKLDKAVFATTYAFAVRQFKFPDTDHDLAAALAKAAQEAFLKP